MVGDFIFVVFLVFLFTASSTGKRSKNRGERVYDTRIVIGENDTYEFEHIAGAIELLPMVLEQREGGSAVNYKLEVSSDDDHAEQYFEFTNTAEMELQMRTLERQREGIKHSIGNGDSYEDQSEQKGFPLLRECFQFNYNNYRSAGHPSPMDADEVYRCVIAKSEEANEKLEREYEAKIRATVDNKGSKSDSPYNNTSNNGKIGVVTYVSKSILDFGAYAIAINAAYCEHQGYFFKVPHYDEYNFESKDMRWNKVLIMLDMLLTWGKDFEYLVWIDADMIMVNMSYSLRNIVESMPSHFDFFASIMSTKVTATSMIIRHHDGDKPMDVIEAKLNSGSFVIRNTRDAFNILLHWWDTVDRGSLSDQFGFEGVYQTKFTPEEKAAIGWLPPRVLNSEFPIWLRYNHSDNILHLMNTKTPFREAVLQGAYEEITRVLQLCENVSSSVTSSFRQKSTEESSLRALNYMRHNFGVTEAFLHNLHVGSYLDELNDMFSQHIDSVSPTITINGAKEMLRIGQILADSITKRKPEECHVVMSANGKKRQIFESGRDHNVVEDSVDLARRASDFDLILPYAGEYTTIIHEGRMQQAGSDRIVIRPLNTQNFLFYFPVAMYTLMLRNIGLMKNENDKLVKQKGRGIEEWPELLKISAEVGTLLADTESIPPMQRRVAAITVETILTDLLRIVHTNFIRVVYEMFIHFRSVWCNMELFEENGLLAEMQANSALSLANALVEFNGDESYLPRVKPYILMGDVHAALQVKGSDIKGSRQDSAIKSYEAALSIPDPSDVHGILRAKILLKLGNAFMKFDQPRKSLHYFTKCITEMTDTNILLMGTMTEQRSNGLLGWITQNEGDTFKSSMEDEFIGVDPALRDTVLVVRDLTDECAKGMEKVSLMDDMEHDPNVEYVRQRISKQKVQRAEEDGKDNEHKQRGNSDKRKKKKKGKEKNREL